MVRVFVVDRGELGFNPTTSSGRFRPVFTGPAPGNAVVPTMYTAEDVETAIAEALLRGCDNDGARQRLYRLEVDGLACAILQPLRDLQLARLHGAGLKRLGLSRGELIDSDQDAYEWTARWAQALHDHSVNVDGLVWTSRQNDSADALMLWGDRVDERDLRVIAGAVRLDRDPGLDLVRQACLDAGIDFEA